MKVTEEMTMEEPTEKIISKVKAKRQIVNVNECGRGGVMIRESEEGLNEIESGQYRIGSFRNENGDSREKGAVGKAESEMTKEERKRLKKELEKQKKKEKEKEHEKEKERKRREKEAKKEEE